MDDHDSNEYTDSSGYVGIYPSITVNSDSTVTIDIVDAMEDSLPEDANVICSLDQLPAQIGFDLFWNLTCAFQNQYNYGYEDGVADTAIDDDCEADDDCE